METYECDCEACKEMCRRTPCLGTVYDIQKLIDTGYASRLMLGKWERMTGPTTMVLMPAVKGHEDTEGHLWGECTFQKEDGHCELHYLGLKPTEGRYAIHGGEGSGDELSELHQDLIKEWLTPNGLALIKSWMEQM